jgi:hypothetical protein
MKAVVNNSALIFLPRSPSPNMSWQKRFRVFEKGFLKHTNRRCHNSTPERRQQPLYKAIDSFVVYPAQHYHEVVVRIDVDDIGAIADMGESAGRRTGELFLVFVVVKVAETV